MAITKPKGAWTYEDLLLLPDDGKRFEIIDGELYELPSPQTDHQLAIGQLYQRFVEAASAIGGLVLLSPTDVFLPGANPVIPDLVVVGAERRGLVSKRGVEGPPDLVVEVLSPSSVQRDTVRKRRLYERGGVREYWVVDVEARTIEVLVLRGSAYHVHVRAIEEQTVTSTVLTALHVPASAVFGS